MNVPLLGTLGLSGFAHPIFFVGFAVVLLFMVSNARALRRRPRRAMRFANMDLLAEVAAKPRRKRWRHLPVALSAVALALLTTAMAAPTHEIRIPRNRAVVMLVIDVSESMAATDVAPSRIDAARAAGKKFAAELTPGINLGVVEFAANATMLVGPTTDRDAVDRAIDTLHPEPRTATGEGILTALQAVSTYTGIVGGGDEPPPAHIVLESDGAENVPADPNDPRGAFTAARAARDQHVAVSTISFGTSRGAVEIDGQKIPVPVDDVTLKRITEITGGQSFHAGSLDELSQVYATLQDQIGYQTVRGDASASWIRLGVVAMISAILAGLAINRRVPD